MIAWMASAVAAGVLLALAGRAAEEGAGAFGLPRRWGWAAAFALSLLLPLAGPLLPLPDLLPGLPRGGGIPEDVLGALQRLGARPAPVAPGAAAAPSRVAEVGALLWAAWSGALLAVLLWSGRRLRGQVRRAVRAEIGGVPVRISEATGPAVVGLLRPVVVLPAWVLRADERERALMVRHEREHLRAGDTWLLGLAALGLVVMPWNPALWWQHRRLRLAVETDCDARVLAGGADARAYGAMLLRTAARGSRLPLVAPTLIKPRTLLERRILVMTQTTPKHPIARALPLAALSLTLLAGACELSGNRPASSPTEPAGPNLLLVPAPEAPPAPPEPEVAPAPEPAPEPAAAGAVKRAVAPAGSQNASIRVFPGSDGVTPLYFVDGREVPSLEGHPVETIQSVEVLKGEAAVERYGERARGGVIWITSKRKEQAVRQETGRMLDLALARAGGSR